MAHMIPCNMKGIAHSDELLLSYYTTAVYLSFI